MIRNVLGSLLVLIGAAAAVWSPFRPWYDGRQGRDFRLGQLFDGNGITGSGASLFTGLFLPMLVVGVLALLCILLRSRLLGLVAGVLTLGFTILWMIRQGLSDDGLTTGDGGLNSGVWLGLAGGFLLLLGAVAMRGRHVREKKAARRGGRHAEHRLDDTSDTARAPEGRDQRDQHLTAYEGGQSGQSGQPDNTRPLPHRSSHREDPPTHRAA